MKPPSSSVTAWLAGICLPGLNDDFGAAFFTTFLTGSAWHGMMRRGSIAASYGLCTASTRRTMGDCVRGGVHYFAFLLLTGFFAAISMLLTGEVTIVRESIGEAGATKASELLSVGW